MSFESDTEIIRTLKTQRDTALATIAEKDSRIAELEKESETELQILRNVELQRDHAERDARRERQNTEVNANLLKKACGQRDTATRELAEARAEIAELEKEREEENFQKEEFAKWFLPLMDLPDDTPAIDKLEALSAALEKYKDSKESEFSTTTRELTEAKIKLVDTDHKYSVARHWLVKVTEERDTALATIAEKDSRITELEKERSEAYSQVEKVFGSSDHDHLMLILQDRAEAEEVIPAEEYQWADGVTDLIRWMKVDRDEARTERDTATRELAEARAEIARLQHDNADLSRWKKEQQLVASWWSEIDQFIRKHKDAPLGVQVSKIALTFLQERDAIKAELEELRRLPVNPETGEHQEHAEALRNICLLFGFDPSEGEGTTGAEVYEMVKSSVDENERLQKLIAAKDNSLRALCELAKYTDGQQWIMLGRNRQVQDLATEALSPDIAKQFVRREVLEECADALKADLNIPGGVAGALRTKFEKALTRAEEELAKGAE